MMIYLITKKTHHIDSYDNKNLKYDHYKLMKNIVKEEFVIFLILIFNNDK